MRGELRLKLCQKTIPFHLETFSHHVPCQGCGKALQWHDLLYRDRERESERERGSGSKQDQIILEIFCLMRNLRMKLVKDSKEKNEDLSNSLPDDDDDLRSRSPPRGIPYDDLREFLKSTKSLKSLKQQNLLETLYETIQNMKNLNQYDEKSEERFFRLLITLDTFYFQLYYYTTQSSRELLPSPHLYFSLFLSDVTQLNHTLQNYLSNNLSVEFQQLLAQKWGLESINSFSFEDSTNNPLLDLHFCRWRETVYLFTTRHRSPSSISDLLSLCRQHSLAPPPSAHPSMRLPNDPLLPELHKIWFDSVRIWACHLYSYATPTTTAIDKLISYAPLVEVGAGTGYWAHIIQQRALQLEQAGKTLPPASSIIQAFDRDPTSSSSTNGRSNSYHGRAPAWTNIISGGATDSILSAHRRLPSLLGDNSSLRHGNNTELSLFLCYPPPDCDMALQALRQYLSLNGQMVCYVGEYRGDTGTKSFEKLLGTSFECEEEISLPNWGDTCYSLTIWKRRSIEIPNQFLASHPCHNCCVCGKRMNHIYRCRITYSISFCSQTCASTPRGIEIHQAEFSARCLLNLNRRIRTNHNARIERTSSGGDRDQSLQQTRVSLVNTEVPKKRKKRQKLRKHREPPTIAERSEVKNDDSDSGEDEDILTQLKKLRGSEHSVRQIVNATSSPPLIEFSSNWFMTL